MKNMQEIITSSTSFVNSYKDYISVYHQRQRKYSLYVKEAEFLVVVYEISKLVDEVNMMHLSDRIGLTPGAISQTASRAERKGYITREMSKRDRRANVVTLTKKGKNFCEGYEQYMDELKKNIKNCLGSFSEKEIETFINVQGKLTEALDKSLVASQKK